MYIPNTTITNLIVKYIVNIELNNEKIKNIKLPYKNKQDIYEKIHAEDIDNLGEIINTPIGYSKAYDIQKGKTDLLKHKIFNNYRSTQEFIKSYKSSTFIPISAELIAHLNKLLLSGILEVWEIGKFRKFSEQPNEIYENWTQHKQYYPNRIPENYFNDFATWIYSNKNNYHKLLQTSLILYEFIDNAPLFAANQITALLTMNCALKDFGYSPQNTFCATKAIYPIHQEIPQIYKMSRGQKDQTLFAEAILYVLSLESTKLRQVYENTQAELSNQSSDSKENLNNRQQKILEFLEKNQKIERATCTKIMGVSFMTAYRDLTELVYKGYIEKKGENKNTYYIIKEDHK